MKVKGIVMETINMKALKSIVGNENVGEGRAVQCASNVVIRDVQSSTVVRPGTIGQVQDILRFANSEGIPVVIRGSGSAILGKYIFCEDYIILDMKKMNKIHEINIPDLYCRVEAGVIDDDLNRILKPLGIFYPSGPASSWISTIGGEIANNTSGIRSVKYGSARDSMLGMKIVLANGDLVSSGLKTRLEASGYQIERLMVGSEGTLGVIVEATLGIVPIPEFRGVGFAKFRKFEDAGVAICYLMSSGIQPSLLELMDNKAIQTVSKTMNLDLQDTEAILLFEADGIVKETVYYEMGKIIEFCGKNKGFEIGLSYDLNESDGIYDGDKNLLSALFRFKRRLTCMTFIDVMTVVCSNMTECVRKIHEIAERNNVILSAYGHYGSSCMHIKILMDPIEKSQRENARQAITEVSEYIGSIYGNTPKDLHSKTSGESPRTKDKVGSSQLMRAVKKTFDPNNILNPCKFHDATENFKLIHSQQIVS